MYPGWTISIDHAEIVVSYQLAGDWEVFAAYCAEVKERKNAERKQSFFS
jgi:hypothetical protein